jgi:hypothetical protein
MADHQKRRARVVTAVQILFRPEDTKGTDTQQEQELGQNCMQR